MNRTIRMLLILALVLAALCVTALADGIYVTAESGATLAPVAYSTEEVEIDGVKQTVYTDAEKLEVTVSSTQTGSFYLVLALEGEADGLPTAGNIRYINQATASGGTVTFTVYPDKLESGKTYGVYISSNTEGGALKMVGAYKYYQSYKLGDANNSGDVDISDAITILQYLVDKASLPGAQYSAADVNKSGEVNISDAVCILQYLVGKYSIE